MNGSNTSVIIPAHNAANTIAHALKSLQNQSYSNWKAIVVDDGSTDETYTIAVQLAAEDSRIQVVQQSQQGVSSARNTGIDLARSAWLLFLDADDWIAPNYLEEMTAAIESDPSLDAVCCGWVQITLEGTEIYRRQAPALDNLFEIASGRSPFIIHACLIRREVVLSVGGFDASRQTCEDWDLWQRIARSTVRFGAVNKVMAFYRMRSNSLSRQRMQMFKDAMQIIEQGHLADPRVPHPQPRFLKGQPAEQLPLKQLYYLSWLTGMFLEQGENPKSLLASISADLITDLDAAVIASCLAEGLLSSACYPPENSLKLWFRVENRLQDFLFALEERVQASGLARQVRTVLERFVADQTKITEPVTIGATHAVRVEVTQQIANIIAPSHAERLYAVIELEETRLGTIELPIYDCQVDRAVLVDAIASRFFWAILGRFFENTCYRHIPKAQLDRQTFHFFWAILGRFFKNTCYRHIPEAQLDRQTFHDQNGWTIFLRELWNRPNWSSRQLYDPLLQEASTKRIHVTEPCYILEVSAELPEIETTHSALEIVITIGGMAIGAFTVPVEQNLISAQALRCAVMLEAGVELCIASVREALVGRSLTDAIPLQQRLAEAAQSRKAAQSST
ncbi:glycosyltransferase family 2 protein [Leptolyngbya sp. DQ-M1]|uniref:glycosyltransferase family 2 protein n=1 Tax=Leptolyngbya sp. DQ-M1 TaxID=2933920 RepID=UPI003299D148